MLDLALKVACVQASALGAHASATQFSIADSIGVASPLALQLSNAAGIAASHAVSMTASSAVSNAVSRHEHCRQRCRLAMPKPGR